MRIDRAVHTSRVDRQAQSQGVHGGFCGTPDRGDQVFALLDRRDAHPIDLSRREVVFLKAPLAQLDVLDVAPAPVAPSGSVAERPQA